MDRDPNYSSEHLTSLSCDGYVGGVETDILIDTGSAFTLIDTSLWREVGQNHLKPYDETIISASGAPMEVLGITVLDVHIADVTMAIKIVVVKNLAYKCILGIDFFQLAKVTIDFESMCLRTKFGSKKLRQGLIKPAVCKISAQNTTVIPSGHEIMLNAKIQSKTRGAMCLHIEGIFSPSPKYASKGNLLLARSVVRTKENIVPVRIINVSNELVTLYRNTTLGTVTAFDDGDVIGLPDQNNVNKRETKASCHVGPVSREILKEISADTDNCTREEKQQFEQLILEYQEVFSKGPSDLGHTSMVSHRINTGNAPRRLSPIQMNVVQDHLQEMSITDLSRRQLVHGLHQLCW